MNCNGCHFKNVDTASFAKPLDQFFAQNMYVVGEHKSLNSFLNTRPFLNNESFRSDWHLWIKDCRQFFCLFFYIFKGLSDVKSFHNNNSSESTNVLKNVILTLNCYAKIGQSKTYLLKLFLFAHLFYHFITSCKVFHFGFWASIFLAKNGDYSSKECRQCCLDKLVSFSNAPGFFEKNREVLTSLIETINAKTQADVPAPDDMKDDILSVAKAFLNGYKNIALNSDYLLGFRNIYLFPTKKTNEDLNDDGATLSFLCEIEPHFQLLLKQNFYDSFYFFNFFRELMPELSDVLFKNLFHLKKHFFMPCLEDNYLKKDKADKLVLDYVSTSLTNPDKHFKYLSSFHNSDFEAWNTIYFVYQQEFLPENFLNAFEEYFCTHWNEKFLTTFFDVFPSKTIPEIDFSYKPWGLAKKFFVENSLILKFLVATMTFVCRSGHEEPTDLRDWSLVVEKSFSDPKDLLPLIAVLKNKNLINANFFFSMLFVFQKNEVAMKELAIWHNDFLLSFFERVLSLDRSVFSDYPISLDQYMYYYCEPFCKFVPLFDFSNNQLLLEKISKTLLEFFKEFGSKGKHDTERKIDILNSILQYIAAICAKIQNPLVIHDLVLSLYVITSKEESWLSCFRESTVASKIILSTKHLLPKETLLDLLKLISCHFFYADVAILKETVPEIIDSFEDKTSALAAAIVESQKGLLALKEKSTVLSFNWKDNKDLLAIALAVDLKNANIKEVQEAVGLLERDLFLQELEELILNSFSNKKIKDLADLKILLSFFKKTNVTKQLFVLFAKKILDSCFLWSFAENKDIGIIIKKMISVWNSTNNTDNDFPSESILVLISRAGAVSSLFKDFFEEIYSLKPFNNEKFLSRLIVNLLSARYHKEKSSKSIVYGNLMISLSKILEKRFARPSLSNQECDLLVNHLYG